MKDSITIYIDGHLATIVPTLVNPGRPAFLQGHPDGWEPAEPAEVEYEIYDENGNRADWLGDLMDSDQAHDLETQILQEFGS